MVTGVLLQTWLSAVAGVVVAVTTALLTDYREKRRAVRTEVLKPLYGELTGAISGELPTDDDGYASLWADLDYYKAYRVDATLADELDRYSSDLSELAATERDEDVDAFVEALPAEMCEDGAASLASGRTFDMRTWLRRNMVVLSTAPAYREDAFGFEPADLAYLWREVDGVPAAVEAEAFDTADALAVVSTEFNWGYEALYEQWDDGWLPALADAFLAASQASDGAVQETLLLRRDVGESARDVKGMIAERAGRGLLAGLSREWLFRSDD